MKVCTKCQKESNSFSPNSYWCRPCKAEHEREKRLKLGKSPRIYRRKEGEFLECLDCSNFFPVNYFNISKRGSYGRASYCKLCQKIRCYPSKLKNGEAVKRYRAKGFYRANHRLREFIRRQKIKVTSDGSVTKEFIINLLDAETCSYCKKPTTFKERTIDHVVALNDGGKHVASNLVMACTNCNSKKRDLSVEDFCKKYGI